jgi:FkbM family methyltransferase
MARTDPLFRQYLRYAIERFEHSSAQVMQDMFVDFILQKKGGTFVEFGGYDGITYSNSHYLEREKEWRGVLAEPTPSLQELIAKRRPMAILEKRCVYARTGTIVEFCETGATELSTIKGFEQNDHMGRLRRPVRVHNVETISLDDLITTHFPGRDVDYVSIDTEGSEWEILQNYRFTGRPSIFTIEHNFLPKRDLVSNLMQKNGYLNVFRENTGFDDWYVRSDVWRMRLEDRSNATGE